MIYDGIIEGNTVYMRSVFPDDAVITYNMRTDTDKVKYIHPMNGTVEDQRKYIINQNKIKGDYLFLVMDKRGKPIGMRGIYNIANNSAESGRTIGYGDAFQNMEALLLGFDFAFGIIGVDRIYMDAATENSSIRGIQKKIGAVEYDRKYLPDLGYEYVFSVLEREQYFEKGYYVRSLIERYAQERAQGTLK